MSDLLPDISFSADLELEIGSDVEQSVHVKRQAIIDRYAPRYNKLAVGIDVPANSAAASFVTDEPSPGRRLEMLRFHLDIATPIVALQTVVEPTTVTVYLVAAGDISNVNNLASVSVLKRYTTLPIDDNFPHRSTMVDHPENVYIIATNSGGTPVILSGNIQTVNRPVDAYHDPKDIRDLLEEWNLVR